MGRAGSGPEFHVNAGSGLVGSLHLWVGLGRVKKIGPTPNFGTNWMALTAITAGTEKEASHLFVETNHSISVDVCATEELTASHIAATQAFLARTVTARAVVPGNMKQGRIVAR